nr:ribulose-phosphate 3-epimerase [Phycisphaerae bacterium]NIP50490.1 ribulose-phosphate 3-epimerase [Phycisphaerae bacterium]NIU11909.1 ribulose-phosphate 3-epimerase [Phycisphaerae bacterium]NIW91442.1 ribulose-phosphate 3-epimerase [Phycisphaerae bacterium]NIX02040.1 ribulose-phosphate 3-epimerase [Phycisphaerae bacterium]
IPVGVDGGVDTDTAPLIVEAGATVLIAGSSVYNTKGTVRDNVDALLKSIQ